MNIKLKVQYLLLTFIIGVLLSNCTKAYIPKDTESNLSPAINGTDTIKYQPHISVVISNNCVGCHAGSNPQGSLLPNQTRALFDRWVQNGYLEN